MDIDQDKSDPLFQYLLCIAKSERSSDMQGYAVRLSAFVANICIAILIAWSKEAVIKESVNIIMLQSFVILLSSAIAMGNTDLSVSDAHFALTMTISPLSIYFVYSTYRFWRGRSNHLYNHLGSAKAITATMSAILFVSWIIFDLLIYFSDIYKKANCKITLLGWMAYKIVTIVGVNMVFAVFLIAPVPLFWIIYFIRHFKDIREEYRRHVKKTSNWKHFSWVQHLGRSIKSFIISQWDVITRSHKWLFFLTILIFYVTWAGSLVIWADDLRVFFYEVVTLSIDPDAEQPPNDDFDPFNYGQLLAAAIVIQPVWGVLKLSFFRRDDILSWLKQWPQSVWNGIVFICTGHRNPWKKIMEMQEMHDSEKSEVINTLPAYTRHSESELPIYTRYTAESLHKESFELEAPDEGAVFSGSAAPPQLEISTCIPTCQIMVPNSPSVERFFYDTTGLDQNQ